MTVKEILTPVITRELEKYEQCGGNIKLKSTTKKRTKYTVICGIIAFLGFAHPVYFISIPIYIILMRKTRDKVNMILSLAKKRPDTPIEQIVAEEINA